MSHNHDSVLCILTLAAGSFFLASCSEVPGTVDDQLGEVGSAVAGAPAISHGPIVGAVRPDSAKIWLRTSQAADVVIEHSADASFTSPVQTAAVQTSAASDFTAKIPISGLSADAPRYYRVYLNGALQAGVRRFDTAPLSATASFSFSVLSDFKGENEVPALTAADALDPDLLVFLGDLDHRNPGDAAATPEEALGKMRQMHRQLRGNASPFGATFASVVVNRAGRQLPFIHVWDDHDFGTNNSDTTFQYRAEALQAFDEYFVKASRGNADPTSGVWQLQPYGAADLFVLDLRSEREPNDTPDGPGKSMLGAQQKTWLKNNLLASTKRWKFILSTVPFNPTCKPYDAWGGYAYERSELVSFIQSNQISGVIIVSGDIHSGGAIDDGTNSGAPEVSVPHANCGDFVDTFKGQPGTWSHGLLSGTVGAGFAHFEVSQAQVVMTVRGPQGEIRKTYTAQ